MIIQQADINGTLIYNSRDVVDVTDAQRKIELRDALGRALNCWANRPVWLEQLYDELSK